MIRETLGEDSRGFARLWEYHTKYASRIGAKVHCTKNVLF